MVLDVHFFVEFRKNATFPFLKESDKSAKKEVKP